MLTFSDYNYKQEKNPKINNEDPTGKIKINKADLDKIDRQIKINFIKVEFKDNIWYI